MKLFSPLGPYCLWQYYSWEKLISLSGERWPREEGREEGLSDSSLGIGFLQAGEIDRWWIYKGSTGSTVVSYAVWLAACNLQSQHILRLTCVPTQM